jgi:hypothetical protein
MSIKYPQLESRPTAGHCWNGALVGSAGGPSGDPLAAAVAGITPSSSAAVTMPPNRQFRIIRLTP